jgi:hypothetical protein
MMSLEAFFRDVKVECTALGSFWSSQEASRSPVFLLEIREPKGEMTAGREHSIFHNEWACPPTTLSLTANIVVTALIFDVGGDHNEVGALRRNLLFT